MSSFPTGDPLADTNVLLQVPDSSLASICSSSVYLNELCQNDYFWKLKLERRNPGLLPLRNRFPSYRTLYNWINSLQAYVVHGIFNKVYNNIQDAYTDLVTALKEQHEIPEEEIPPIERAEELIELARKYNNSRSVLIYDIPSMTPLLRLPKLTDPTAILFPLLDSLPVLKPGIFLGYTIVVAENTFDDRVVKFSREELQKIFDAARLPRPVFGWNYMLPHIGSLLSKWFYVQRSNRQEKRIFQYRNEMFKSENPSPLYIAEGDPGDFFVSTQTGEWRPVEEIVEYL